MSETLFEQARRRAQEAGDKVPTTDLRDETYFGAGVGVFGAGLVAERVRQLIAGGSMTYTTILNPLDVVERIKTVSPLTAYARGNWVHVVGEDGEELCKLLLAFTVDTTTITMTGAGIDELNVGEHTKKLLDGDVNLSNFIGNILGNATESTKRLATFNSILETIESLANRQIQDEENAARKEHEATEAKAEAERRATTCRACGSAREKEKTTCPNCGAAYVN